MTPIEKVEAFIKEYQEGSEKIKDRIFMAENRLSEVEAAINSVEENDIPEGIELRVITGDGTLEKKANRALEKLQKESKELQEEVTVMENVLYNFNQNAADKAFNMNSILQDEIRLANRKAYDKMMDAKEVYMNVIREEALPLHHNKHLDVEIQVIQLNAGRRKDIYGILPVYTAGIPTDAYRYNDVYLPLTLKEVKGLILNP